ncbi:DUF2147 domain-containing protein [Croceivirga lutea]|uniref:DUF2147 domain-containing protein n=1 Tax=Croceivirga lutea TaxID=1775167 RepID=UPI00163B0D13|nr:DUF2147 domain-containing protein [Croceivirga lutea]
MKHLFPLFLALVCSVTFAQTIEGQWETIDDTTNEKKALIEIYETNDKYYAKIVKSYISDKDAVCLECKGDKKNAPIPGLVIIEGLEEDGDEYNGGTILDPENGKTYKCYVELASDDKLKVRGYLGFALIGRTQYWVRKK